MSLAAQAPSRRPRLSSNVRRCPQCRLRSPQNSKLSFISSSFFACRQSLSARYRSAQCCGRVPSRSHLGSSAAVQSLRFLPSLRSTESAASWRLFAAVLSRSPGRSTICSKLIITYCRGSSPSSQFGARSSGATVTYSSNTSNISFKADASGAA